MKSKLKLRIFAETWPIRGSFAISRGSRTTAEVVVVELQDGPHIGRGESVPYARYNETVEGVVADIERHQSDFTQDLSIDDLQHLMPPGAARKAVDCALWDLGAKRQGRPVWQLAGLPEPQPVTTAFTISLGAPEVMETAARNAVNYPLLKVKLGCGTASGDADRIAAVRRGAPQARLIVDANEAWSLDDLQSLAPSLASSGVALVEQPLPAGQDEALAGLTFAVPLCADESCHGTASLDHIIGRYQMVNIKLNKTGGLTEAIKLLAAARAADLGVMVGCMVGTSLAMAPAHLIAGAADYVDLDGPLLLERDREPGIHYDNGVMSPPPSALWG